MNTYFEHKVALFQQEAADKYEALKLLSEEFIKAGVAYDTFYTGLTTREANFPTGLQLNRIAVAIPHTDPEHVVQTQIGFMNLTKPVKFIQMGTDDEEIEVTCLFMLALKEAHQQMDMIMKLMDVFQDDDLMDEFNKATNYDEFYQALVKSGLNEVE